MSKEPFKAMVVEELENNVFRRTITDKHIDELPQGDVLINVKYSTLNYKDALSANGHKGITRNYPHTPGVDAAGIVAESSIDRFFPGDKVIVTGYDLGMNTAGGFAEYIRVPGSWVVKLPENLTLRESMIIGTAGFTAGCCIYELRKHEISQETGKILVTGATGGVGCLAVGMLAQIGYHVVASTGKTDKKDFLSELGAKEVIHRDDVIDLSLKPLLKAKWMGVVDTVGGTTLTSAIRSTGHRGVATSVGLVESDKIEMTVYPFILRGVSLIGIDSAERPMDYRLRIWEMIANVWKPDNLEFIVKETDLNGLNDEIDIILKGNQVGKVLVIM